MHGLEKLWPAVSAAAAGHEQQSHHSCCLLSTSNISMMGASQWSWVSSYSSCHLGSHRRSKRSFVSPYSCESCSRGQQSTEVLRQAVNP